MIWGALHAGIWMLEQSGTALAVGGCLGSLKATKAVQLPSTESNDRAPDPQSSVSEGQGGAGYNSKLSRSMILLLGILARVLELKQRA